MELNRYMGSKYGNKWQGTHQAKFGVDVVASHGPIVVRPLDLKAQELEHEDFATRRAEMEKEGHDEAVGGLDEDNQDDDHEYDEYDDTPRTIPYEACSEDDDDDTLLPDNPRFVDAGWASDCLHDTEDIDFEFVYALHTFVATVEGQANATKGDTMVLLDDSNSYWWLVRVVKDSSIGA